MLNTWVPVRVGSFMSAVRPKADMCGTNAPACFGPEADIRVAGELLIAGFVR